MVAPLACHVCLQNRQRFSIKFCLENCDEVIYESNLNLHPGAACYWQPGMALTSAWPLRKLSVYCINNRLIYVQGRGIYISHLLNSVRCIYEGNSVGQTVTSRNTCSCGAENLVLLKTSITDQEDLRSWETISALQKGEIKELICSSMTLLLLVIAQIVAVRHCSTSPLSSACFCPPSSHFFSSFHPLHHIFL